MSIVQNIISRVRTHVNSTLTNEMCLQIAIASSMRESESTIGFLTSHQMSKLVNSNRQALKLSDAEWSTLFGSHISPNDDTKFNSLVSNAGFTDQTKKIENALRLTILEHDQSAAWKKSWCKAVLYIAMHLENSDAALLSSLGTIIKADQRRIEDLVTEIDDKGVETLVFVKSIEAVSRVILGL